MSCMWSILGTSINCCTYQSSVREAEGGHRKIAATEYNLRPLPPPKLHELRLHELRSHRMTPTTPDKFSTCGKHCSTPPTHRPNQHQSPFFIICASHCAVMTPWYLINASIDFIVKCEIRCMDSIAIHQNALAYKLSVYILWVCTFIKY